MYEMYEMQWQTKIAQVKLKETPLRQKRPAIPYPLEPVSHRILTFLMCHIIGIGYKWNFAIIETNGHAAFLGDMLLVLSEWRLHCIFMAIHRHTVFI